MALLQDFLHSYGIPEEQIPFISKEITNRNVKAWMDGYAECNKHTKKRKKLLEDRSRHSVRRFLDYLSDLTHK